MSIAKERIRIIPDDETPTHYNDMPEGLSGYWWETEHYICIPFVQSKNEGDGTFGKWLEELEAKGKIIHFPTVISARLDAILRARGYMDALAEFSKEEKEIYQQPYCECLALFPNIAEDNP